jgi:hypothetical protein
MHFKITKLEFPRDGYGDEPEIYKMYEKQLKINEAEHRRRVAAEELRPRCSGCEKIDYCVDKCIYFKKWKQSIIDYDKAVKELNDGNNK